MQSASLPPSPWLFLHRVWERKGTGAETGHSESTTQIMLAKNIPTAGHNKVLLSCHLFPKEQSTHVKYSSISNISNNAYCAPLS
jgi:hypothetical protein